MQVRDIVHTDVKTTSPSDTFERVATVLREHGISSVIVLEGDTLAGIVTERDLVNLVAEGGDPKATLVSDRMSTDLDTVDPKTDIAEAADHMEERLLATFDKREFSAGLNGGRAACTGNAAQDPFDLAEDVVQRPVLFA